MRTTKLALAWGVMFAILGAAAPAAPAAIQETKAQEARAQAATEDAGVAVDYKIGPRDLLEIRVFEMPEMSQTVRVSEDGSITLPLLQKVDVMGLTKDQLEQKLVSLLKEKYVRDPQVSVFIREYQSKRVSVIGAVEKPGSFELVGRQTLLSMISQAGGLKETASDRILVLRRGEDGQTETIPIDMEDLMENGNPALNIPLQADDVVNIPADRVYSVYVFGEVRNPGAITVRASKGITLLQAIAQAGGTTENASLRGVVVKRKDPKTGREDKMTVNIKDILNNKRADMKIREGDVIYVKQSIF